MPDGELAFVSAGPQQLTYLSWRLQGVTVRSVRPSAAGDRPGEVVTLDFASIEVEYCPQEGIGAGGGCVSHTFDGTTAG